MSEKITGRQAVLEALKSGRSIEKILTQYGTSGPVVDSIYKLAKQRGIPIAQSGKQKFRQLAGDSAQGVLAFVAPIEYTEVQDLLTLAEKKHEPPFILVLDEIEDPHNLGALIRTAECTGIHGVVIPKHHAAPVTHTVVKSSAGAVSHVAIARVANIGQTIDDLKRRGAWVVGADANAEKLYYEVDYRGPVALVIGSEGKGIRKLVKHKCDFLVRIPMYGKVSSLNASVAGGLLMFEVARQRH
jgi:23S rRNA (guanosine2251-2'-O)-methyltransferase